MVLTSFCHNIIILLKNIIVVFLTCNNINKIGRAVKRPGRVDQIYYLTYADDYQINEMFWRFFGKGEQTIDPEAREENPELQKIAKVFVSHIRSLNQDLTTATLQKFFLEYEKEKEIEYYKQQKEQEISKSHDRAMNVSINTKDLKDSDEIKQQVDNGEEKEKEEDEYQPFQIDLTLLMDRDYVKNLFEKIHMETGEEEQMMEEIAKKKIEEQKKKEKEERRKEQEERSKEKEQKKDDTEDTEDKTAEKSDVADTNGAGAPSPPASPLPNGVTSSL